MSTTVLHLDDLAARVGTELGTSDPVLVSQDRIDAFAGATGAHQWIHTDPARAASGPFGGTIAHGYLTLSLAPALLEQVLRVEGVQMGVNYGANRVRFPAPVPVGSELVMSATLADVEEIAGGAQVVLGLTFTVRGATKPSCVAEVVYRFYR